MWLAMNPGARARVAVVLVLMALTVSASGSALAQLAALVVDRSDDSLRVVSIDSGEGSVTPGSASVADCCLVGAGLTAADAPGERFFAFGRDLSDGDAVLVTLAFDGNAVATVVPARLPQALLAHDGGQDRLVSVELGGDDQNPALQWFSIDPDTGVVADIGVPDTTCCELLTGLATVQGPAQVLYFVGREFGQNEWRIRSVSLSSGAVNDIGALPADGRPGFMRYSDSGGHLDVYMQDGSAGASDGLYRVDPVTGIGSAVAAENDADCCLLGLGQIASLDAAGEAWWIAGSDADSAPESGFLALFAEAANGSVSHRPIDGGDYALHALIVNGEVVSPGLIFRDRFE